MQFNWLFGRGSGEGVLGGRASYSMRLKRGVIDLDPLLVSEAETVSLTMRFTPLNPNGLLFWMGEEQTFSDYFLALAREFKYIIYEI